MVVTTTIKTFKLSPRPSGDPLSLAKEGAELGKPTIPASRSRARKSSYYRNFKARLTKLVAFLLLFGVASWLALFGCETHAPTRLPKNTKRLVKIDVVFCSIAKKVGETLPMLDYMERSLENSPERYKTVLFVQNKFNQAFG